MKTNRKAISRKAAADIGSLYNSINVAKQMMDSADMATEEGSEQYIRWELNLLEAVRDLRDTYGITVPFWTETLGQPNTMLVFHRAKYGNNEFVQTMSERNAARNIRATLAVAKDEWIKGTARSLRSAA